MLAGFSVGEDAPAGEDMDWRLFLASKKKRGETVVPSVVPA